MASFFAKGNVLLTQIVGASLVALALLFDDSWSGAMTKFAVWQAFILCLCLLTARHHEYFSFVELDKGIHTIVDRVILSVLNFGLIAVWAMTFLNDNFALVLSLGYAVFIFFLFSPSKEETA